MGNEQVLLSDHSHRDRAIRVLLGSEIILGKLSPQVKRQRIDVALALQKTHQRNIDLIVAGGRDQAQSQHGQQERSYLSPVHSRFALTGLKLYPLLLRAEVNLLRRKFSPAEFLQHRAAALADCGVSLVLADVDRIIPAAFALGAVRLLHLDMDLPGAIARTLERASRRKR